MLSIGDTAKVHYTGKYTDGKVFDSTEENDPILFTIGDEMMISGFEEAVMAMEVGEKKTINLKAADAYGVYDKELMVKVDRKQVFGDKKILVGESIQIPTDDGVMLLKVHEIKDDIVILDGNSDMAGKDVIFEIELLSVMPGDGWLDGEDELEEFEDDFEDEDFENDTDDDF